MAKSDATIFDVLGELNIPGPHVVFELGAATGNDTPRIVAAMKFQPGEYYALEPEPDNLPALKSVASGIDGCHVLPIAVGNENRRAEFHRSEHENPNCKHTYSGSLKEPREHLTIWPWCRFVHSIDVPMARLDDLAAVLSVEAVDFIWSDIQGADDWFFDGAQRILAATSYLYTECFDERLYDGQLNMREMLSRLPGSWAVARKWEHDVLLRRV